MLSFQHVIKVKIIEELFYILFQNLVCIWCLWHRSVPTGHVSRAGERHADTGQLVGQRGRAPVPSSQRDLSGDRRAFPRGCPNADVMTEPAGTLPAPAEMPRPLRLTHAAPFGWAHVPQGARCAPHSSPAAAKRTVASRQEDLGRRVRPRRGAWDPGVSTDRCRSRIVTQRRSFLDVSAFPSEQQMGPNA